MLIDYDNRSLNLVGIYAAKIHWWWHFQGQSKPVCFHHSFKACKSSALVQHSAEKNWKMPSYGFKVRVKNKLDARVETMKPIEDIFWRDTFDSSDYDRWWKWEQWNKRWCRSACYSEVQIRGDTLACWITDS